MSVHLNIDQSGVVGVCLNRIPERQCTQVSYRFLTAENLRLVLSRGSFLLWLRGGLVP